MKSIYLDYASTTPIDPKVLREMLPYLRENFGNASSIHSLGQKSQMAIDKARKKVADFLGCAPEEIIFTGSATEANNLAISGIIEASRNESEPMHIITTRIEHKAVLNPVGNFERKGVEVTYLSVNGEGLIKISDLAKSIKDNTVLISIVYANNEMGAIQPIAEIGEFLKNVNRIKERSGLKKVYFHTDAVQAANWLPCDVKKLGVDLLTLSGHKIYGPKGVGALYIRKGTKINPQILGGGQEQGLRSGTENVAGIVGLGAAIGEVKKQKAKIKKIKNLREKIINAVFQNIPEVELNGSVKNSLPNIINFSFKGAEGEATALALNEKGIYVSTGSACAAKSLESSHVLLALGKSEEDAHSSVRISLGRYTADAEIKKFLKILQTVIEKLRKISGYAP